MKFQVYHAVKPTFGMTKPNFPTDYKKIAIVETNDLEDVFRITNHIDEDWRKNPEVLETIGDKFRSTSVGDVVVDEKGEAHYCDVIGWNKLDDLPLNVRV